MAVVNNVWKVKVGLDVYELVLAQPCVNGYATASFDISLIEMCAPLTSGPLRTGTGAYFGTLSESQTYNEVRDVIAVHYLS